MYSQIKTLERLNKVRNKNGGIKDEQGQLISKTESIKNRWKRYTVVLYDRDGRPNEANFHLEEENTVEPDALGPDLLESEITSAIKAMKNNKAEGTDEIPGEIWKNLGQEEMEVLIDVCKNIYAKGTCPSNFTKAVMICCRMHG